MKNCAVSIFGTKDNALYFDYVVPLSIGFELLLEHGLPEVDTSSVDPYFDTDKLWFIRRAFDEFLPPSVLKNKCKYHLWTKANSLTFIYHQIGGNMLIDAIPQVYDFGRFARKFSFNDRTKLSILAIDLINRLEIKNAHLVMPRQHIAGDISDETCLEITLSGLELIDTSKTPIELISEFRKRPESQACLRRLRLFAQDNYKGRSASYIEDDISLRLYDYENEVKAWGMKTRNSAITTVLNSKTLLASAGGSLLAALNGSPIVASSAILGGALLEIGRVALTVSESRMSAAAAMRQNPISYIAQAQVALEGDAAKGFPEKE